MIKFKYKQNDIVKFDLRDGVNKGLGIIVGCSTMPSPVIGSTYMVEVTDGSFPNEVYPFGVIPVFEQHLERNDRVPDDYTLNTLY